MNNSGKKTKVCNKCKKEKSVKEFHTHPATKDRLFPTCKTCKSEREKELRENKKVHNEEMFQHLSYYTSW